MSTTIRISRETKRKLEDLGHKSESFDDIVTRCAIALFNENNMYSQFMPVETPVGVEYIEIRVPKHIKEIMSTNIFGKTFNDALATLCEEHDIKFE